MKNILKSINLLFLLIFTNSCNIIYNHYEAYTKKDLIKTYYKYLTDDYVTEMVYMNQFNNLNLFGFALMVGEYVYIADGVGIHKTTLDFKNLTTIVFNHDYEYYVNENLSSFRRLQYYEGNIYFLDSRSSYIYSMNLDGSNLIQVLSTYDFAEKIYIDGFGYAIPGGISEFIVVNNRIYFNYFLGGAMLHYFDLYSREIVNLDIMSTPILTLNPDRDAIQFTHNLDVITNLNLKNHTLELAMPLNIDYLIEKAYVGHIWYTTNVNGKLAFGTHVVYHSNPIVYSRIFVVNKYGYAEEIHREASHRSDIINIHGEIEEINWGNDIDISRRLILTHLNSIGYWIYFNVIVPFESINMYRIKRDGTKMELIYENLLKETFGNHHIFMNIISEDIIMWRNHPLSHITNVLIRNEYTKEFENIRIN